MSTFQGSTLPDDSNNNSDNRNDSNERGENAHNGDASAQAKGSSPKRIEANRRNSLLSTGPRNTERTRHNAVRHGLLAAGLTEWDNVEEYQENVRDFNIIYLPTNPVDRFLVEHMALDMVPTAQTEWPRFTQTSYERRHSKTWPRFFLSVSTIRRMGSRPGVGYYSAIPSSPD